MKLETSRPYILNSLRPVDTKNFWRNSKGLYSRISRP